MIEPGPRERLFARDWSETANSSLCAIYLGPRIIAFDSPKEVSTAMRRIRASSFAEELPRAHRARLALAPPYRVILPSPNCPFANATGCGESHVVLPRVGNVGSLPHAAAEGLNCDYGQPPPPILRDQVNVSRRFPKFT